MQIAKIEIMKQNNRQLLLIFIFNLFIFVYVWQKYNGAYSGEMWLVYYYPSLSSWTLSCSQYQKKRTDHNFQKIRMVNSLD